MEIQLKSDNYNIIEHGDVFLPEKNKDLTLDITIDDFKFSVVLIFQEDETNEYKISQVIQGNQIIMKCINFSDTGTNSPIRIAEIKGKEILIMFWSFLVGEKGKQVRSVRYTLFCGV